MGLWKRGAEKWRIQTSSNEKVALALHLKSNHPDKISKIQLDYLSVMGWPLSSAFIIQLIFSEFQGYILCRKLATQVSHVINSIQSPERRVFWYNILAPASSSSALLFSKSSHSEPFHEIIPCYLSSLLIFIIMWFCKWYEAGPVPLTCPCDEGPKFLLIFTVSKIDEFERVRHLYYSEKLRLHLQVES